MKIKSNIKFLQEGGAMTAPAEAPETAAPVTPEQPQGGEDPIMMLAQMAAQAIQNNDGQMALQVCQGFLQLVQQMAGEASATEPVSQGEPVYRRGGKLAYRIKD